MKTTIDQQINISEAYNGFNWMIYDRFILLCEVVEKKIDERKV